jgi:tetratricopeptide (TPR) repeat protein
MDDAAPIFISYRRSDAAGHARALHEYLSERFGVERIFFDRSTIESGDVFPDTLRRGVEGCVVLLALIAPDWLDSKGTDGNRRLDDPNDFVRHEIALALTRGKRVIPVLFDDAPVPPAHRLPEPLRALASCDALTLRGKTYEYRNQRRELVRLLAKVPDVPDPPPEASEALAGGIAKQLPAIIEAATRGLQQLSNTQQETIRTLERQLGVTEGALATFFQIIGEAHVPSEQQPARLIEIATQWRRLRGQVAAEPGDAPEVAQLKDAARAALDVGRLDEADDLLARVETAQDAALDQRQRVLEQQQREVEQQQREVEQQQIERAAIAAQRGGIALTRLRYREAAQHFAAAARRLPPGQEERAVACLYEEADALYRQGEEFGDHDALVDAIARYRMLLDRRPRERVPLDWATTQNKLGTALWTLAERESGTAGLEEAVAAFRLALEERTRERVPLDLAGTQNNLGIALMKLGEWASGAPDAGRGRLEEAVAAHRLALEERTRERVPLDWAATQNDLGAALTRLGERESGAPDAGRGRLEEAVAAYRLALEERTRERVPLD